MNKLISQANSVEINNIEYPKNSLLIEQKPDGNVVLKNIHTNETIAQGVYTDWRNNTNTVYASKSALITALRAALFV